MASASSHRVTVWSRFSPFRPGEAPTAWLMFAWSFLAMSAYNIVKPVTRATFISAQGADNLPYVQLAAGVIIGLAMHVYTRLVGRLPRRWIVPATIGGMAAALLVFWMLFRTGAAWVPAAFFVFGLLLGLLLISQFWTLANDIYDARQARRLFGFIGGGASLGGAAGAGLTSLVVDAVGTSNLLPLGALALLFCAGVAMVVVERHPAGRATLIDGARGVGGGEALRLLRESRHLQVITMVIACAAIGATFVEQQLNMAAAAASDSTDAITRFLANVTLYVSLAGFAIQVGVTGRIHRSLGLVAALLLLPVSLGATAVVILLNGAIWAPAVARVLDTSLRYSVDKTTREMLFLPLPADLTYRAKPFVDVTMERFARAVGAVALLVLIKPWGLGLTWQQVSYATLAVVGAWVFFSVAARREYLREFRRSLDAHDFEPAAVRFDVADASTVELLADELEKPDEESVVHAIDMLETLGRLDLVTPLLLHHRSPRVRARAVQALAHADAGRAEAWLPTVRRMLHDEHADVRAAAVGAVAALRRDEGADLLRRYLDDAEPRVAVAAAVDLADSDDESDAAAAEGTLARVAGAAGPDAAEGRRDVAASLARIANPAFHSLLIPLIHDPDEAVAREAIASARAIGSRDALFVPALVSLLGHRRLKTAARDALVGYGGAIVPVLAHVLADRDEPIWVRRHVPNTLAGIPTQASMDALTTVLDDRDGFLRYKAIVAVERLRRARPDLVLPRELVERRIDGESARYYSYLTLRQNIVERDDAHADSLLAQALADKLARTLDRLFRLLGLLHPWRDIAAARYAIERAGGRARAGALEYLDNVLAGPVRKRVMPIIDTTPIAEKVRHANSALRTRPRDVADTVAQLVHEDDPVLAAAAVHFVASRALAAKLRDDLEFVMSHRRDQPIVAEAAAWALGGAAGAPAQPPPPGEASLPVVELANRLRVIPLFAFVSIDELFRVAQDARQVRLGPGDLYRQGAPARDVLFLIDGAVRVTGIDPAPAVIHAPAALNLADVLEGRPLRHTIAAEAPALGLTLAAAAFLTMLSDNIAAAQGLFRMLLVSPGALDWANGHGPRPAAVVADTDAAMDPIELATRLRQMPLFGRATVEHLRSLTAVTADVALTPGAVLWDDAREPSIYHVLRGEVTVSTAGGPDLLAGAGGTIGVAETLVGASPGRRAMVTGPGRALRLDRDALFDVLADHGDLLQDVFGVVLGPIPHVVHGGHR